MGEKLPTTFTMRLEPEDAARFSFLADDLGMPWTMVVRQCLREKAEARGFSTSKAQAPTKKTAAKKKAAKR